MSRENCSEKQQSQCFAWAISRYGKTHVPFNLIQTLAVLISTYLFLKTLDFIFAVLQNVNSEGKLNDMNFKILSFTI